MEGGTWMPGFTDFALYASLKGLVVSTWKGIRGFFGRLIPEYQHGTSRLHQNAVEVSLQGALFVGLWA